MIMLRASMLFLLCLFLGSCAVSQRLATLHKNFEKTQQDIAADQQAFHETISDRAHRVAEQDVSSPWLAGKPQALAREIALPEALQGKVDTTLLLADAADLPTLAERLALATNIAVRVRPDALLPADMFLPRLSVVGELSVPMREQIEIRSGPQPLPDLLDMLAAQFAVRWRYRDGALEFYRTETRVFDIRALTLVSRADARLGRAGNTPAGAFESTSNTVLSSGAHNAVATVRANILPFLTRAGVINEYSDGSTSVVVTDTPDVLDLIGKFIERENKALTRRIRLVFEEITVVGKETLAAGIDWTALYQSARVSAGLVAPSGLASALTAGTLQVTGGAGRLEGSKGILSALSSIGSVVRHSTVPVLTLNRRPVTHAVRTTFSYIDKVQSTAFSGSANNTGSSLPAVSISQKEETVGTFLTLLPDIQEDGQILLSIAYDNAVAQPLKTITFGERGNQVQVQQITIDGNGTVQQVELRPGQPMIVSGFDKRQNEYDRRRLSKSAPLPLGGHDRTTEERSTTLILITAQVEEGF